MFKELFSARSLQTAAISLAFGLIGAMALALIGSIFFLSAGSSWASKLSMVPGLSHMMSDASGSGTVTPNFFQFLILVMVLGVSGQLSPNITGGNLSLSSIGVSGHLWMPVGLSGVALVLGTAFGAYWFARKFAIRFKWTGIVSSVIVGVVMGFVYLILAAIFPLTLGAGSMGGIQAKAILTGVSARTYFMTLLLAAIGAFFGYLLAQYASDSNNVFTAAWKWAHRTRGFVRTLLDAAFIYAVVFTVIGFICLIMLSSSLHNGQMFMLFPILLPYLSFLTFALGSLRSASRPAVISLTCRCSASRTSTSAPSAHRGSCGWYSWRSLSPRSTLRCAPRHATSMIRHMRDGSTRGSLRSPRW